MLKMLKNSFQTMSKTTVIALLALPMGCATTSLTRQDVIRQYEPIAELNAGLEDSRGRDGTLLSPSLFNSTEEKLNEAFDLARNADKTGANAMAEKGLDDLATLNKSISKNYSVMEEVVDIRDRANQQNAAVLFEEAFNEADESFRSASLLLENGKTEEAQKMRSELIEMYAKLELDALKKGTVAVARKAISSAENADADDYAPKTLQSAREELKLALSVLDADRTQVEKGNAYANHATWLASRAQVITELSKYFESQNFSSEDVLLWYQAQLQRVRSALQNETLPFDQSNGKVIQVLRADSLALKAVMKDTVLSNQVTRNRVSQLESEIVEQRLSYEKELQQFLAIHEQQLAALDSGNRAKSAQEKKESAEAQKESAAQVEALRLRLSAQALAQAELDRAEARSKERFVQTQKLFDTDEAEVFRQGNNVLIRLKGFDFKSGKSNVEARNYALLNKVVAAINTFPKSDVTITGHTDSRGNDKANSELSSDRAHSVVEFLSTVGGVSLTRLTSTGMGEEQPLATNDTADGRSENRRIDLLIVNK